MRLHVVTAPINSIGSTDTAEQSHSVITSSHDIASVQQQSKNERNQLIGNYRGKSQEEYLFVIHRLTIDRQIIDSHPFSASLRFRVGKLIN